VRALDLALVAVRLLIGAWLLWRVPALGTRADGSPGRPALAVVVPARDEADNLGALLGSVVPQLRSDDELVVVDDHSTDATAAVAGEAGARVVAAPELPPGWTGKAWACHTGAEATTAPVVVLLDADVVLEPGALDALAAAAAREGGLVSVAPHHQVRRPYEQLSGLFNVVAVMGTGCATPRGTRARAVGAFGPVLATTRRDLATAGGHAHPEVRGAVLDDLALGERYRAEGLPVALAGGRGVARYRMYPAGPRQLVEGWTKNIARGATSIRPTVAAAIVAWVTLLVQGALAPALAGWPWGAALYAVVAAQVAWMLRRVGSFHPLAAVAFPVLVAAFLAIFARSAAMVLLRGRARWRGRDVEI
jgi:4,4'-diaponeurosporenoate glycosyltransferase